MLVRGIRGATTVERNESTEILSATAELFHHIIAENAIKPEEVACIFITVTQDLTAVFPAPAIRQMTGWELVPLMCSQEIAVEGALQKCIRLMVMVNTEKNQDELVHVYLREAMKLRPDLSKSAK
jgi:chorismate mutase